MNFNTRYNRPDSAPTAVGASSATRQDAARECDIHYILARVGAGIMPLSAPEPIFADLSDVPADYQDMLNRIQAAQDSFESLPSRVRDRFGSDPRQLFAFLQDSGNRDEAIKLGLIPAPAVIPPVPPSSDEATV